jgi:hypothetical protein
MGATEIARAVGCRRQVRVGGGSRRDRRIEARIEFEPHQDPLNRLEAVARHDPQMVAGAIGDAGGFRRSTRSFAP